MSEAAYSAYFENQATGKQPGDFRRLSQKGEGFGSFLSGLFRKIFPLFKSGLKAVGKETLSTGVNVLKDTLTGKTLKDSLYSRVSEAGSNLTNKAANKVKSMVGDGYKTSRKRKRLQSKRSIKRRKTRKAKPAKRKRIVRRKKTKRTKRDIFD